MKLFDEIKPVFFIDNKMNDILNDINVKLKNINVNDKQKRKYMILKSKIMSIHSSLAIEAYNHINEYNYKSENDLLKLHGLMMKYFDEDNGNYRNHGEGVKRKDEIIYMTPESILVPSLMKSLFYRQLIHL